MTKESKNIAVDQLTSVDVLMLSGTRCPFCGPMKLILNELKDEGRISSLEIINIEERPDIAVEYGVRSVPWLKIGDFELSGSHNRQEIIHWLDRAEHSSGDNEYISEKLGEGNIGAVRKLIQGKASALKNLVELMADGDAKINVRLGIGVIMEELAQQDIFSQVTDQLLDYLNDGDARVRSDACHYLSLTGNRKYINAISSLLDDENAEVREIAEDSLEELNFKESNVD